MASSSDLFEQNGSDFSTEGTPDRDFWSWFATESNQNEEHELGSPSRRESDWGHVLLRKKTKKNKRLKIDVSSTGGSSGVNSTSSELSEALSAISAALSLSSSSSGMGNEDEELIWKVIEDLQIETAWNEKQNESSFHAREPTREDNFMAPPAIGMEFSSEQEVLEFYQIYAKETGFSVRKGKVQRLSNGNLRKKYYFCSKEGTKQSNKKAKYKRKETRTGCRARIQCTIKDGKWVISQFFQDHNHPLSGTEAVHRQCTQKSRTLNQESSLISTQTIMDTGLLRKENVVSKFVEYGRSGMSLFDEYVNNVHPEDAQILVNYLRYMQEMDPSFFYAVQLDANDRIKNYFWRDGKSKIDYDHFGDVLIFDTTFKMDSHGMICAPFMGLNHHRQYVLYGCAFLLDESIDSVIWLYETFKDAMGRRQPKTIFTDVSQAMAVAADEVFPEAKHQFGLWHILRNSAKFLSKSYAQSDFESLFNEWISGCQTVEEFYLRWNLLLEKFNLHNNLWLHTLYISRDKWTPLFSKNTFRAGIPDSVNINGIFQKLTSESRNLLIYVQQYLNATDQQRRKECYEDFHCKEKAPEIFLNDSLVEKQAARIYTSTVFKIFQRELLKCFLLTVEEISSNGRTAIFKVAVEGQKGSIVEFNCLDSNVTCSCRKYESDGVLCMHALKVLDAKNIFHIPIQYILKRWTKSAKDYTPTGHEHIQDINGNQPPSEVTKCNQPPSEVTKSNDYGLATGMSKGVEISIFNNAEVEVCTGTACSSENKDGESQSIWKKLNISKEKCTILEGIFKQHTCVNLNPEQQLALARQLDLHPSQVDVWFQIKKSGSLEKEIQKRMDCRDDICIDVDTPINEADLIEAFKYFDRNGDGKITGQNLLESFKTLGEEDCTLEGCQSMIAALDKNGNGFMSFEDFSHMLLREDN